jgi:hypothetical protein
VAQVPAGAAAVQAEQMPGAGLSDDQAGAGVEQEGVVDVAVRHGGQDPALLDGGVDLDLDAVAGEVAAGRRPQLHVPPLGRQDRRRGSAVQQG